MSTLLILVGPPGSGKSTVAQHLISTGFNAQYVNQDSQGKVGHREYFEVNIKLGNDIIVDRMNFNRQQRNYYIDWARSHGYIVRIMVLHENYETCLKRCIERQNHETIKDEKSAKSALNTFFSKYERPTLEEADEIQFFYPHSKGNPLNQISWTDNSMRAITPAIWVDLDGTLCNVEHRRHHVRPEDGSKKNWKAFFDGIPNDTVNEPVMDVIQNFTHGSYVTYPILYCTGRSDDYKQTTYEWLVKHEAPKGLIFMRNRHDHRSDDIVKEIILDFEVLTRHTVFLALDDRDRVVKMLRKRGIAVFQVADGDF